MSRYVKELIIDQLKHEYHGIDDVVLVSLAGMDAVKDNEVRLKLQDKDIRVQVVKNSLARAAFKGTPLEPGFKDIKGVTAIASGSTDIVRLAKEITSLAGDKKYEKFVARGAIISGQVFDEEGVKQVSKWPSREEVLSTINGQIIGVARTLNGQLVGTVRTLAGQIKKIEENQESPADAEAAAE